MNNLVRILTEIGPSLSSDLVARLRSEGRTPTAARQYVSRLPKEVRALGGLTFPKRARFLFLNSQYQTRRYWENLLKTIRKNATAYASAIAGLESRGGIIPSSHFSIISGSPCNQRKHISSDVILDRLSQSNILERVDIAGIGPCVKLNEEIFPEKVKLANFRARLLTEKFLIDAIRKWAGHMNMASPDRTTTRDDISHQNFSTFQFDITGPCYIRPVTKKMRDGSIKCGFFVADIIIDHIFDSNTVVPFIKKHETLSALKSIPSCLPMLIADGFSPDALRMCRSKGLIATTTESLFGHDIGAAIRELYTTLTRASIVAATDFPKVERLFEKLSAVEGAAGNLRGALFELIVGSIVRTLDCDTINIGKIVTTAEGKQADIDVLCIRGRNVTIYECKGYSPTSEVSADEILKWITISVPRINKALRLENRFSGSVFRFEFWTAGNFSRDAIDLLNESQRKCSAYELDWKNGDQIRGLSTQLETPRVTKILDEHYFRHPVSKAVDNVFSGYPI